MEYQHLLEKYEDMSLIAALILPEHTEDAINGASLFCVGK